MALRQWMVTHEWMVKPTPQTEWIEHRGVLVWIAEVFTSLGAGLYLVSLFFNNWWGMLAAWFIVMFLKVPLHLIYFGKPLRFWRTIPPFTSAWKTSWFTRGITFSILFGGIVFIQLIITYFFPGTGWDIALRVLGGIFAFLVGIYSGFIMSYCRSVPFWNSALLPLILIFAGIADGFALIMAVGLGDAQVNIMAAEAGSRILLSVNAVIMAVYLWNATYTSKTSKYSAILLLKGSLAMPFWAGVVACGIIIPLVVSVSTLFAGEASAPLLIVTIVLHTIGAVALKYVLLKAGIHNPILPTTTSAYH
ncbi:MAG: NrfD/PsrC family molybdoenzyme membrane anchor subunit [Dehalococcoidales bacterium]